MGPSDIMLVLVKTINTFIKINTPKDIRKTNNVSFVFTF